MNNKSGYAAMLAIVLGFLISGCASETAVAPTPVPADAQPTATAEPTAAPQPTPTEGITAADVDARRAEILNYITNLSNGPFAGVISGQNCYHGTEILSSSWTRGYENMIEKLHAESGQWVGIIGLDYEFVKIFTPAELTQANKALIDYGKAGGIVTVTLTPLNPWVNDESDLVKNPGSYDGPAGSQNADSFTQVKSLNDLIDSSKPVNAA
ncbi:MAG: hypothetical protein JW748_15795 [Anaerolineales bacterium]|nr:hypothetical protein [Anaerolineales bacterium]